MFLKPRGYCLIINNEDFSNSPHEHSSRVGSQFDAESIKALFEELYFEVEHWHNLDYLVSKTRGLFLSLSFSLFIFSLHIECVIGSSLCGLS